VHFEATIKRVGREFRISIWLEIVIAMSKQSLESFESFVEHTFWYESMIMSSDVLNYFGRHHFAKNQITVAPFLSYLN
jgi:hypothetical protein